MASTFSSSGNGDYDSIAIALATEIAENEISHVRYLRKALTAAGATPVRDCFAQVTPKACHFQVDGCSEVAVCGLQVACPAVSISPTTFTDAAAAAATAAGITLDSTTTSTQFDPYSTAGAFFLGAFIFEDVGVTAYHGAIANLEVSFPEAML